jgi:pre-mRNA-splicing factor SYF1
MAALERQARAPMGFVAASSGPEGGNRPQPSSLGKDDQAASNTAANPDAIDLDEDMNEDAE